MEHNKILIVVLWVAAALAPIAVDGSFAHSLKPVPPFLSPAPSPFSPYPPSLPPHPEPYPPSLPPNPSPYSPSLPPHPEPYPPSLPPHPSPYPPSFPPNPSPYPPSLPPNPSPYPPSLPPHPSPPPHAPPPFPPNMLCFPELLTCKNTNTSNPSTICCDSLKIVYEKDEDCICTILESPDLTKELGLNATDISYLLLECKITSVLTSVCNSAPAPAPSSANHPPPPPPHPKNEAAVTTKQVWTTNFFSIIVFLGFFML